MKFIYTAGPYREYRGHCFANYKPTTILDRHTGELLSHNPEFKEFHDEEKNEAPAKEILACPKCGKTFKRGLAMHIRFCKS